MPWIVENTAKEVGERFLRKLPAGRLKFVGLDEATVFRTKKLAEKEASKVTEYYRVETGEVVSFDEWWNSHEKCKSRISTTLLLHEVEIKIVQSESLADKG